MSSALRDRHAVLFMLGVMLCGSTSSFAANNEEWLQLKYDSHHSGNIPNRTIQTPLGLLGTVALSDAVFTSPVVADGRICVVDGSGVAYCIDAETLQVRWKFASRGGNANCNNVSSPAIADRYLHFGTMGGSYYVLDSDSGRLVKGDPLWGTHP